jgi:hypothetical protein
MSDQKTTQESLKSYYQRELELNMNAVKFYRDLKNSYAHRFESGKISFNEMIEGQVKAEKKELNAMKEFNANKKKMED